MECYSLPAEMFIYLREEPLSRFSRIDQHISLTILPRQPAFVMWT